MLLVAMLPLTTTAQVEKQVEVTKAYEPTLERAEKLSIAPDMTDTMQLRPEIDYTITPLSLQTTLTTRPIRPAQVSYWEFNRPRPFYLKAGIGAPWQSELDLYAATQNPTTGYLLGYLNHTGRYASIENDRGDRHASEQMQNRVGVAAGRPVGKRTVEGDVHYSHRLFHRYGAHYYGLLQPLPSRITYGDLDALVRIGDDFQNLTRTNFEVVADGSFFFDHTDPVTAGMRGNQSRLGIATKVARAFGDRRFLLGAGYRHTEGAKALNRHRQQLLSASLRYGSESEQYRYEVGADYYYDRFKGRHATAENYLFPFARVEFDLIADAVKPFAEIDGSLKSNDYQSLTHRNPYLEAPLWLDRSTAEWEVRGGLTGHSKRTRFNYRAYAAVALRENQLYWLVPTFDEHLPMQTVAGWLTPMLGRQTVVTLGGEVNYRPINALQFDLAARFFAYNDEEEIENGLPAMEGEAAVRYEDRKVRIGLRARFEGARRWTVVGQGVEPIAVLGEYKAPFTVDLGVDFEWLISAQTALYLEARNLLCRECYRLPTMPEYGINGMVGVRIAF